MLFFYILEKGMVIKLMLKYELMKVFSNRINRLLLVATMIVGVIASCFAIGSIRYIDKEGELHAGITAGRLLAKDQNAWKGEVTPEELSKIVKEYTVLLNQYLGDIPDSEYGKTVQSYYDLKDFVVEILTPDIEWDESVLYQLTDDQLKDIYMVYQENMKKMAAEYGTTPEKKSFLEQKYEEIKLPFNYEGKEAWETMTMYAQTYVLLLAVVIGFLTAGIFSAEFRPGAEDIFFASRYGRSKAVKNKILAGVLMATVVYWIGVAILSLIAFSVMGTSGFFTPYQMDDPYSIYIITYGEYYLLILACGYVATMFSMALVMLVTAKMHTPNLAVCIPFILLCLIPFIERALTSFSGFFNLMPTILTNVYNSVRRPVIFQIGSIVFRQIPCLAFLYTGLFIVLLPIIYKSYRKYGLKKK